MAYRNENMEKVCKAVEKMGNGIKAPANDELSGFKYDPALVATREQQMENFAEARMCAANDW